MQHYDIAIIGAGIQGAGLAQAAAIAGYRCITLEKKHVGAGTSSQSSKLIHGGLRYLKTGQVKLVYECLQEQKVLLNIAPDLVKLVPFHIPVYRNSHHSAWQLRIGLQLYQWLAKHTPEHHFSLLPKPQWQEFLPLNTQDLTHLFSYYDAQTDDLELTQRVMHSAQTYGAELIPQVTLEHIDLNHPKPTLAFATSATSSVISASLIFNCTGPWSNHLLTSVSPKLTPLDIEGIKGSHLLLKHTGIHQHFYLESPSDQRAIFALPWKEHLLLGTTEVPFTADPYTASCSEEETQYLLSTLFHYFPKAESTATLTGSLAGIRVLPKSTFSPFNRSRETIIQQDNTKHPRLISVAGGKLTTYRLVAEKLINKVKPLLPKRTCACSTKVVPLPPLYNR